MADLSEKGIESYSSVTLNSGATAGAYRQVKTSAGHLFGWHVRNLSVTNCQLRFYNSTTPATTTDTPVLSISIPGVENTATGQNPVDFALIPRGINFSAGITILPTLSKVKTKETAVGADSVVIANVFYK